MIGNIRSQQFGGGGGSIFSDDLTEFCELARVNVRSGAYIDAIQAVWRTPMGSLVTGMQHGGNGGSLSSFNLEPGEWIAGLDIRHGSYIDQLTFRTSRGREFGPYGGSGGTLVRVANLKVMGFFGRSGVYLDGFGMFSASNCS